MPRQPVLPKVDWTSVIELGMTFDEWIAQNETPDNCLRMKETLRKTELAPGVEATLRDMPRRVHVIAIAEDWCGDVLRHVPVLQRMAESAPNLSVRFTSRLQHPGVFIRFLTNGGEAIPKFIFLNHQYVECGNWGPMPAACRDVIARGKACGDIGGARRKVSAMYADDPDCEIVINELLQIIDISACFAP
jgi:hypothetical protein